jgi:hypothetical protein
VFRQILEKGLQVRFDDHFPTRNYWPCISQVFRGAKPFQDGDMNLSLSGIKPQMLLAHLLHVGTEQLQIHGQRFLFIDGRFFSSPILIPF